MSLSLCSLSYPCVILGPTGKTLSLISKKNIRYLGTLYSINEQNATVALQNVRSYGTEGREEEGKFVAPSDAVHPFLLFRGQDIKDLHVHEEAAETETDSSDSPSNTEAAPTDKTQQAVEKKEDASSKDSKQQSKEGVAPTTAKETAVAPSTQDGTGPSKTTQSTTTAATATTATQAESKEEPPKNMPSIVASESVAQAQRNNTPSTGDAPVVSSTVQQPQPKRTQQPSQTQQQSQQGLGSAGFNHGIRRGRGGGGRGNASNNRRVSAAPGTGASLLNRTARGSNSNDKDKINFKQDFDFQSNLEEFQKENEVQNSDDGAADSPETEHSAAVAGGGEGGTAYDKDNFFDSISNDASDRASGIDNRLRGREERSLNTETFGAVALNHSDNYRRRTGRGGGRGRSGGGRGGMDGRWRGGGRGGRGRGGGGRGGRGGRHHNNNNSSGMGFRGDSTGRPTTETAVGGGRA